MADNLNATYWKLFKLWFCPIPLDFLTVSVLMISPWLWYEISWRQRYQSEKYLKDLSTMLAKILLRLFWNLDSKSFIIFKILHQKKTLKKLYLEKWWLKSIEHLVTLLYYIIQRHVKNDMILRRWYWTEKKVISISRFAN